MSLEGSPDSEGGGVGVTQKECKPCTLFPYPWNKRLSKVDQNLPPQLWVEGSWLRMPLEGKVIWGRSRFQRSREGTGLLKGTGALTWTLQGAGVEGWGPKVSTAFPGNAHNRETRQGGGEN